MNETASESARSLPNHGGLIFLAFVLGAGPLAWFLDLSLKFVLASNACLYPRASPGWLFAPSSFVLIDLVAILVTAVAMWQAYQSWNATAPGHAKDFHAVTEIGEHRQHFLALWGMLIGAMFLSAIVFSLIVNLAVQPCP